MTKFQVFQVAWEPCVEAQSAGLDTWMGGDLKKCTVCTLIKMLTILDGP